MCLLLGLAIIVIISQIFLSRTDSKAPIEHDHIPYQSKYEELRRNTITSFSQELTIVKNELVLSNLDRILLDTLLDKSFKLIFRFGESSCNPCIQRELQNISNLEKSIPKNKIIVIASYDDERKAMILLNNYNIESRLICLSPSSKITSLESDAIDPCLFLLNKDLKMNNVFFSLQEDAGLSIEYYQNILRLLQ